MKKDLKAYIGVDIGTSSIAAVVVDHKGGKLEKRGSSFAQGYGGQGRWTVDLSS